jgi:hypothetical protein
LLEPLLEFLINVIFTLKERFIFQKEYISIRRKYLAKVGYTLLDFRAIQVPDIVSNKRVESRKILFHHSPLFCPPSELGGVKGLNPLP